MWSGDAAPAPAQHREGEGIPGWTDGIDQSESTNGADAWVDVERCRRPTGCPSRQPPGHRLVPSHHPAWPFPGLGGGGLLPLRVLIAARALGRVHLLFSQSVSQSSAVVDGQNLHHRAKKDNVGRTKTETRHSRHGHL
ncbi:uncharacterized protein LOC119310410 [Triticum dicoccoides]|uniref:uncharacterized protein LOC119310410 n=1 Tax=Triticum dicoccoides TaxID=85692 RepID=UPI001890DA99|nr:uncharacterized protein LOC119310410 [Triticum dicoccoides]